MTSAEDWTKFVTLNPPNEVKFTIVDETDLAKSQSIDPTKAVAKIQIINKSKSAILFKVKTTNIKNYMVRPNADLIPSNCQINVKIQTQQPVSEATKALTNDRFLVQLTKLDSLPSEKLSVEEIAAMWEKVDKSKLVQYKLKVDLNQDVQKMILEGPEVKETRTSEITNVVTGQIKDKMLIDSRDQKPEETKEKPEIARFSKPGSIKSNYTGGNRMEDIKEQDSEAEIANSGIYNSSAVTKGVTAKASVAAPKQPSNVNVQRKISESQAKIYSLESQLARLKNSKSVMDMKNEATGKPSSGSSSIASSGGFQLFHLIFAMVLGILIGAYLKAKVFIDTPGGIPQNAKVDI